VEKKRSCLEVKGGTGMTSKPKRLIRYWFPQNISMLSEIRLLKKYIKYINVKIYKYKNIYEIYKCIQNIPMLSEIC